MRSVLILLGITLPFWTMAQTWNEIAATITPCFLNSAAVWDGKVYFSGGAKTQYVQQAIYNKQLEVLDIQTEKVTTAPGGLSVARCAMSALAYNGKIYFIGGHLWTTVSNTGIITYNNVDIYDIATQTWSLQRLSESRTSCAAAVVGGKIVIAGGWHSGVSQIVPSDVVDIYDPVTNKWTVAHLSVPRGEMLEAGVVGHKMYVCGGGTNYQNFACVNTVDIYDALTNTWSATTLSQARMASSVQGVGKYLICAGGYTQTLGKTARVDYQDTETGQWYTHQLSSPRTSMSAAVTGNKAYFTGGGNLNLSTIYLNASTNAVDIFDAQTGTWRVGPALVRNRMAHSCVSWKNKVIVGGGWRAEQVSTTGSIEVLTDDSYVATATPEASGDVFQVFPNPATDQIDLFFEDAGSTGRNSIEICVYDLTGKVVLRRHMSENSDCCRLNLSISDIPSGTYRLHAVREGGRHFNKLLFVNK